MSPHSSPLGSFCFTRFRMPSAIAQHSVGKPDFRKPRQPDVVFPSNSNFQPAAFSLADRTFCATDFPLLAARIAAIEKRTTRLAVARLASDRIQARKVQQPGVQGKRC